MKYNIRNLLWHMKCKGLKDEAERITVCKNQLLDAIQDNIDFFRDYKNNSICSNTDFYYTVPMSNLSRMTLDQFIEIQNRFNNAMTGLFGLEYDNLTWICISDIFGRKFIATCYKHPNNTYSFNVWDMSGQYKLYQIETKDNELTFEQIKGIEKCHDILMQQYEEQKESANRYKKICKYKDFIRVDEKKSGYANYICKVHVRKDIPIELTSHEIAKYVDDWNYCFGGSISRIKETKDETVYSLKVYTD